MTKKIIACLLLAAVCLTGLCSCGEVKYAATIGDEKLPVGPYAYYAYYYRDTYEYQLQYYGITDFASALLQDADSEGTKLYTYITNETQNAYQSHVIIGRKFDELGLKLSDADLEAIDKTYQEDWVDYYGLEAFSDICKTLNMTAAEFKDLMSASYKYSAILNYYFGKGGMYEITDEQCRDKFESDYSRFKYIGMTKVDSEGNLLSTSKLVEKQNKILEAYERAQNGESFEDLIREYSESYTEINDEMTDDEVTNYTAANAELTDTGILIDKNGIFNETYYYYYGYSIDSQIVNAVFTMNDGDMEVIELDSAFWLVKKYDKNETEDFYNSKYQTIYSGIQGPIWDELFTKWESQTGLLINTKCVSQYDPRKIDSLFYGEEIQNQAKAQTQY